MSSKALKVYVFGGTSDAVHLCQMLEEIGIHYELSVATDAGVETAAGLKGKVNVGRLEVADMINCFKDKAINLVIDATHPFAAIVSKNIQAATKDANVSLIRFERPSQIDLIDDPLVHKVNGIEEACQVAKELGQKVFLTTGSKDLAEYRERLPQHQLIARVLPVADVIQSCVDLGFGIGEIVAMKGPYTEAMNEAMYTFYQPDLIITKESGSAGGFEEKIQPCLTLKIPCIVIRRPKLAYGREVQTIDELRTLLMIEIAVKLA